LVDYLFASLAFSLNIKAPEIETKLIDIKIRRGEVAHFQATFHDVEDERDTPDVTWKKEGRVLNESKHVHMTIIGNVMHLKILNSQIDDTGRYTLRLENEHGAIESSAHLIVRGKLKIRNNDVFETSLKIRLYSVGKTFSLIRDFYFYPLFPIVL